MRYHHDERAKRFCALFDGMPGDVNLFILRPGQVSAWHKHNQQTDQFMVLDGCVLFGVLDPDDAEPEYLTLKSDLWTTPIPDRLQVNPGSWHGYQNTGETAALLLMYLSHKYEDGWDEERRTLEEMPWNP